MSEWLCFAPSPVTRRPRHEDVGATKVSQHLELCRVLPSMVGVVPSMGGVAPSMAPSDTPIPLFLEAGSRRPPGRTPFPHPPTAAEEEGTPTMVGTTPSIKIYYWTELLNR